jgi:hypothetical protein
MTEPKVSIARARELLAVPAAAGARARVLGRVLAVRPGTVRRPLRRALVLATALLVSATAAAVAGPALVRWTGWSDNVTVPGRALTPPSRVGPTRSRPPLAKTPSPAPMLAIEPPPSPVATDASAVSSPLPPATVPIAARPAPTPAATSSTSTLAQEVAAYREAAALVATSPALAVVRLRTHREHFPASALGPEVSLRLVQAFTALGRGADARREAQSFLIRYPRSPKRAEMQAIVDGTLQGSSSQ